MNSLERRRFQRLSFNLAAELSQHELPWHAGLLDISLKGLLIAGQLPEYFDALAPIQVRIELSEQAQIVMQVAVAHQSTDSTGLSSLSIDMESMSHLRRLIELNLGDAGAAERELAELIS